MDQPCKRSRSDLIATKMLRFCIEHAEIVLAAFCDDVGYVRRSHILGVAFSA